MTHTTKLLLSKLCAIIDENKYLLIEGGIATGKTYLAKEVAVTCSDARYNNQGKLPPGKAKYDIQSEIVSIHPSYSYDDFICGISMQTETDGLSFEYKDKIFLSMVRKANDSWAKKESKKYFLILDDINRGFISGILGDVLALIEPHGNENYYVNTRDGIRILLTPNIYIIATKNIMIESLEPTNYAFARRFYSFTIESNYKYMDDAATAMTTATTDISPNALYNRVKRVVNDNLSYRFRVAESEKNRYILGHGMFQEKDILSRIKYQIIPLLMQYVKEGILEKSVMSDIKILKKIVVSKYSKDYSFCESNLIELKVRGVDKSKFESETVTHKPLINLVSRIKEQGLLADTDIEDAVLFNSNVLLRTGIRGATKVNGYLYVKKADSGLYLLGNRNLYKSADIIKINGIDYSIAGEMQPKEYNRWSEDILKDDYVNEKNSTSPNTVLFLILKNYYQRFIKNCELYLDEWPTDDNIALLRMFAQEEWNNFVAKNRTIIPASGVADDNAAANKEVREAIESLQLLWANRGELISFGGQDIKVEGAYKVSTNTKYKEYIDTMTKLNIHQMIMQGPPGTSKTFSTRGMLKYIGKGLENDDSLTNEELNALQIVNYDDVNQMTEWNKTNPGKQPTIAWDIVQFHPSYGYEDFVRGIEVSTLKNTSGTGSYISYDTVNKILGKMASVASKSENNNTKFFLIIDEINRANLATVFGELIYGLEYRKEGVATPYTVDKSNKISLPDNLYLIGTMNTADKSIGGIDYAIRRRFLFFSLLPDDIAIKEFNLEKLTIQSEIDAQKEINEKALKLFNKVSRLFDSVNLNSEYFKEDVQIGHTYFLVNSEEQLYLRFKYQILPILREYHKDGMFQFEDSESTGDSWSGLLNCISGKININNDENTVKQIFDDIIAEAVS
ncbi:AAA family ATPase [Anaerocolumna sp. MB42-C2]|uniref:AAA family ATPase n=1 Tax=Anaerocolumna sp. MB42-C2 TaxID=3070997 RepID=UPI0027E0024D|nr:AAA family ATPase [Anaerocolumna sp. MB42-C2]WMJ87756.1 AAA family ATPase [Anaerocolumna sp. MB42-C2]